MKKIVWLFTIFNILLITGACTKQAAGARNVIIYENDGSTDDIVLENEFLELRFLPPTAEIILTDKANGMQWRSNPPGHASDPLSDTVTRLLMESQFSLEYADVSGVGMTLYSGEQSIEPGAYHYGVVNGVLEVSYTIGNLARTYVIPPAAPEERMLPFLEKMDPDDRRLVLSSYRLYDINNLRQNDNRAQLLALYPDLSRKKIYVLRPETQEYQKEECEEFFAEAGYTYDDYVEDTEHYPSMSGREKPAFNITLFYSLDGKSLVLNVPFDRIAYRPAFPITRLSLLPYMGAGGLREEGYLLVPDGGGALIRFNNGRQNQILYSNVVYGWDEGMPRDAIIVDNKAPFPAFGIQRSGKALLCIIEDGASYASVRADVAGRNSSWNNIYSRFEMIHSAKMDISSRSERAVYLYERSLPSGESITLRYTPCSSDGYVGMAKEYRSWLLDRYPSLRDGKVDDVPIAVEIPGAVNKTQHRLGIPFDLPLKLTSYKEARDMISDFGDFGWKNVQIKLNGWFNRSVDHSVPTKIKLINILGSRGNFKDLVKEAEKNGYNVFPEVDFIYLKDTKPFDGFNIYRDAARYANRKRIEKYPFSFVWFGERMRWGKLSYVSRPAYMSSLIDGFKKKSAPLGLHNIAFRSLGSTLSGDYNERRHVSREQSMKMRQKILAGLSDSGTGIIINTGYAYAVPWVDFITDMNLADQSFGITDEAVPFYQIVLHGLVPYTGRAINLAEDYTKNLLKTIECGAGLYFSFMKEESALLQETKFRQFYANEYDKWVGDADALYRKFSSDFGGLYSQAIVDHVILSAGVTMTKYEDGTRVIVNASDNFWRYNDTYIAADNYIVLRQGD
ncbi:MAG: DUF5696 domain-containing protein [Treponema sp.]|nr:DUF5696 domain-containing protein [Treponema sp.]